MFNITTSKVRMSVLNIYTKKICQSRLCEIILKILTSDIENTIRLIIQISWLQFLELSQFFQKKRHPVERWNTKIVFSKQNRSENVYFLQWRCRLSIASVVIEKVAAMEF